MGQSSRCPYGDGCITLVKVKVKYVNRKQHRFQLIVKVHGPLINDVLSMVMDVSIIALPIYVVKVMLYVPFNNVMAYHTCIRPKPWCLYTVRP